jgi:hypothetical protein
VDNGGTAKSRRTIALGCDAGATTRRAAARLPHRAAPVPALERRPGRHGGRDASPAACDPRASRPSRPDHPGESWLAAGAPSQRGRVGRPGGYGPAGGAAPGRRRSTGGAALPHCGWGRPSCPAVRSAPGGAQAIRAAARSAVGRTGHVPGGRVGSGDLRPGAGLLGLVKVGQCPPYLGSDALEMGQCGHAGDRPEHEPEPEDGLHLLFLPTAREVISCHDIKS